jgi:hypothetical protein
MAAVLFLGTDGKGVNKSEFASWFVDAVNKGADLSDDDPVLHLRNKMLNNQNIHVRLSSLLRRAFVTKAWNMTLEGVNCTAREFSIRLTGPKKSKIPTKVLVDPDLKG